jgi:hypothetical protein
VSFQQVQKYEKGVNRISSGRLIQIVNALQCSATDLIGSGNNDPIKSTPFSRYASSKRAPCLLESHVTALSCKPSKTRGRGPAGFLVSHHSRTLGGA